MTTNLNGAEYYQRDRRIHPPALTPDYRTSVARSPRQALISVLSPSRKSTSTFRLALRCTRPRPKEG